MPTNKHAQIRYKVIDECLRNPGIKCYWDTLVRRCEETLEEHYGGGNTISKRTIYSDISFMKSEVGFAAPIITIRDGQRTFYKYEDENFSINNQPLNKEELDKLSDMVQLMGRISGLEEYEWVKDILPKLEATQSDKLDLNTIISYQTNIDLKNRDLLIPLFNTIRYKKVLSIEYQSYRSDETLNYTFHPHFLKQYNNRWFLFGLEPTIKEKFNNYPFNLAVDRIISIEEITGKYIKNREISYEDYFADIIGVSFDDTQKPVKINLKISALQAKYIDSKPIHESQKKINFTEKKDFYETSIEVIPNFELYNTLLSFGPAIEILSPAKIRKEIGAKVSELYKIYNGRDIK